MGCGRCDVCACCGGGRVDGLAAEAEDYGGGGREARGEEVERRDEECEAGGAEVAL